ncbi:MAG TPA: DUF4920 domain-containing protein [Pyrinomonadaceae bacterium]|nr:DUF4920 domain-containing protein [Pyrinomonadaceae bacterium]
MKNIFLICGFIAATSMAAFAQSELAVPAGELNSKGKPVAKNEQNAPVELKSGETIKRGEALSAKVQKLSVEKAYDSPDDFAGKTVEVNGLIVRSCKKEGCWMEMADEDGGKSVRVTFGDHAFFIPLNSAGMKVRAQGVFKKNVLSKERVEHMIKDDGATFENRNADGTVTELSFDATGVELKKGS